MQGAGRSEAKPQGPLPAAAQAEKAVAVAPAPAKPSAATPAARPGLMGKLLGMLPGKK
ncbi:MAG TPA: hypothetical protein VGT08_17970 [Terracidiphilus sp.]|nr:hypothetical protein [Terracidiphilus sp.]